MTEEELEDELSQSVKVFERLRVQRRFALRKMTPEERRVSSNKLEELKQHMMTTFGSLVSPEALTRFEHEWVLTADEARDHRPAAEVLCKKRGHWIGWLLDIPSVGRVYWNSETERVTVLADDLTDRVLMYFCPICLEERPPHELTTTVGDALAFKTSAVSVTLRKFRID
jgi:hypothetical protein